MSSLAGEPALHPGRYAAIDVGTHSVQLLVADVEGDGRLSTLCEGQWITRLGQNLSITRALSPAGINRTLSVVTEAVEHARRARADYTSVVGTWVLREAKNGDEFCSLVFSRCGLPVEVITGEQEAELAW